MKSKAITIVGGVTAVALVGAGVAYAASLSMTSNSLSAGQTTVASCQAAGESITPSYVSSDTNGLGYKVTSVNLTGISSGCNGRTLAITVSNGTAASVASGTTTVTGSTASVTLSPSILASAITNVSIQIS